MCGIFAILSKEGTLGEYDLDLFQEMGVVSMLRGMHSAGAMSVLENNVTKIIKTLGGFTDLFVKPNWRAWQKSVPMATALIGHCRYATTGQINLKGAHPHTKDHISLVHNGHVNVEIQKGQTDSLVLTEKIAETSLENVLYDISGSFALIVHDAKTGLIHFVRNHSRPLAFLEASRKLYVMSEGSALNYLRQRKRGLGFGEITEFLADTLYTFDPKTGKMENKPVKYKPLISFFPFQSSYTFRPPATPALTNKPEEVKPDYFPGDTIIFELRSKIKSAINDKEFVYLGKDDDDNTIFFKSSVDYEDKINKLGIGECIGHTLSPKTNTMLYQVKTRTICWEEDNVTTQDGTVLAKQEWRDLCRNSTCVVCHEAVDETDYKETLVYKDGPKLQLICRHCQKDNFHTFAEQESYKLIQRIMS